MADERSPRVVVVGAGFGGLWAARALAGAPVEVTVMDRNNYHTFLPLLYQTAAAELEPEDIIYPLRSILRRYINLRFIMGEVIGIDTARRMILTRSHTIPYDYLVLSPGSRAHFYDVTGAAEHAFPLKNLDDAVHLRNHILCCFETASMQTDAQIRRQMLTFTIVGGGPTGVEYAGALSELVRAPLKKDYPNLDFSEVHILMLEAAPRLLSGLPERMNIYALKRLQLMRVDVQLNASVSQISAQSVILKDGQVIPSETVIWTAGVSGEHLDQAWEFPTLPNGQVKVLPTLQVEDHPEIYVIGDLAHVEQAGQPLLLIATVAIQEGIWAAKNILRQAEGKQPLPFHFQDPGMMAVIGRNAAAARLGNSVFTGFPAWMLWLGVHLFRLIGFRNRILVLIDWAWDYFFFDRAMRLILPSPEHKLQERGC